MLVNCLILSKGSSRVNVINTVLVKKKHVYNVLSNIYFFLDTGTRPDASINCDP